ncbi:hypothetical protein [Streptomyces sp. PSKA30]|uniref:hypothetical protein n=1 Tax=Streptomyces sp. PSKA30 TaxID=2874597 RepID=UPI001CD1514F|nr:hypothetical protein [Streptomyces sp. PSKA30]MBZ9638019.1 hypothetical protein [Streptomyces sp. PSKA30]
MSALEKAARDAVDAADNAEQLKLIAAVLKAQQLLNAQQTSRQEVCQHQAPQQPFDARKWVVIGGVVCVGGCVASVLALAFALAMTAVAVGGTCATACLLVLRSMWRDYQRGR